MASQVPFKKNVEATIYFTLYKNDGTIVANPGTITKKVSKDGGAVADVSASVTEEDTTYGQCSLVLSATEMNADAVWLYITDNTAGTVPLTLTIYTSANLLDDVKTDTAAILADTGTDGVLVAAAAATAVADAMLKRDLDAVEATAPVHSLTGAALKLVSKVDDDGAGSLKTYKTNGTDVFSEQAITTGASLEPIDALGIATAP
jgi:hypothetical protein